MKNSDAALLSLLRDALHPPTPASPACHSERSEESASPVPASPVPPSPVGAVIGRPPEAPASSVPSSSVGAVIGRPPEAPASPSCHSERSAAEPKNPYSPASADPSLPPEDWQELLRSADAHRLLPLILDAAYALPSCRAALQISQRQSAEDPNAVPWKDAVLSQVVRQAIQENEFLNLILALRARGLEPVVVKGPVCRALYPKPLLRPSVDDDLLIPADQGPAFHAALLDLGLTPDDPGLDPETAWEMSWHKPGSPLYLEVQKCFFDPSSDALRGFNEPFEGAVDRAVPVRIQDVTLRTLAPTDHLLFLLLHAFKHFLYSGFGLRIVSDVCLYARQYAGDIRFDEIHAACLSLRCDRFAAALFRIGEKYLELPAPSPFASLAVDETALLEDILASGLLGADIDRLHSANITLGAVADRNTGRSRSGGLRKTLFPPAKRLVGRYPWLERRPWLLPAAWAARLGTYLRERGKNGAEHPAASLRIGRERVELLKTYGVLDE